jgi:hypothetical protein
VAALIIHSSSSPMSRVLHKLLLPRSHSSLYREVAGDGVEEESATLAVEWSETRRSGR